MDSERPERHGGLLDRPLSRRRFLLLSAALSGSALSGYAVGIEPNRVGITRQTLHPEGASPDCRLRFLQLSDLHLRKIGYHEREVARKVNGLRPDFVVVSGDICGTHDGLALFERFLALLEPEVAVYGVPGNWEYRAELDLDRLDRLYRAHHGRLLINETLRLSYGSADVLLTGLDDFLQGRPDIVTALRGVQPAGNHLVLAHCPACRDLLLTQLPPGSGFFPQFMVAGHTHGGQVALFGFAPVIPRGSGRYQYGWYGSAEPRMFVSRGIGTTNLPVRFMAPPEIVCYEWHLRT